MPSFENKELTPSHVGCIEDLRTNTSSLVGYQDGRVFTKEQLDNCIFEWSELAGKTLNIRVDKMITEGMMVEVVIGVSEVGHVYVLHQESCVDMSRALTQR